MKSSHRRKKHQAKHKVEEKEPEAVVEPKEEPKVERKGYTVSTTVTYDGRTYLPGVYLDLTDEEAKPFLEAGTIALTPEPPKEPPVV